MDCWCLIICVVSGPSLKTNNHILHSITVHKFAHNITYNVDGSTIHHTYKKMTMECNDMYIAK